MSQACPYIDEKGRLVKWDTGAERRVTQDPIPLKYRHLIFPGKMMEQSWRVYIPDGVEGDFVTTFVTEKYGIREISIRTIDHRAQRYPTTGDWQPVGQTLNVDVSRMADWRCGVLVGIHEAIEGVLCVNAGITDAAVSAFDKEYERRRPDNKEAGLAQCGCVITDVSEPGDDIHAPYYKQHQLATSVERMLAAELGVSWNDYEADNLALYEGK